MKKSLSLLVAIAMVFSMFATLVSAADEKTAGQKLQDLGVINGTANGLDEDKEWKRQDITILLSRLLQVEEQAKAHANTHGFEDVNTSAYNGFISWAKTNGYFTGKTETVFGINESITNAQFAAVLLRVLKVDVSYEEAFAKAVELKLVAEDAVATDAAVRGDIYVSLLTALDFKIDGKSLGHILGLDGYVVTDVAVSSASATNSKTVVVEFNQEIGEVLANNFVVKSTETDSVEVISSVSVSENKATLTLFDSLANGKSYTVEVSDVTSKDKTTTQAKAETANFTFNKQAAASIEIPKTIVGKGDVVKYVIKDAKGNDITVDFDLNEVISSVTSSDQSAVEVDGVELKATDSLVDNKKVYSVVNVVLTIDDETKFETGNTVIEVRDSVAVVSGIGKVSFNSDFSKDADTALFKNEEGKQLFVEVLGADGKELNETADVTFKSANPTILVVDEAGQVFPVKTGTATVVVTSKFNDKTVTKSVVITVKADAKIAAIDVDKTSVKLVNDSGLTETVKVTLKDQYGDAFKVAGEEVTIRASRTDVAKVAGGTVAIGTDADSNVVLTTNADGVAELELDIFDQTKTNSTVITVQNGTFKKTISVSVVNKAALSGYVVDLANTKLDTNEAKPADNSVAVQVYQKDVNGNKIGLVTTGVTVTQENNNGGAVNVNGTTISANEVGTEKVTVEVNGVKVGTYTITVVNTASHLTKVSQVKNAISIEQGDSVATALFGTGDDGKGAFVGYDQDGKKIAITGYTVYSSNQKVISNSPLATDETGTALLTIVANDNVYTITVKVN